LAEQQEQRNGGVARFEDKKQCIEIEGGVGLDGVPVAGKRVDNCCGGFDDIDG
jgi:hypothetical protein